MLLCWRISSQMLSISDSWWCNIASYWVLMCRCTSHVRWSLSLDVMLFCFAASSNAQCYCPILQSHLLTWAFFLCSFTSKFILCQGSPCGGPWSMVSVWSASAFLLQQLLDPLQISSLRSRYKTHPASFLKRVCISPWHGVWKEAWYHWFPSQRELCNINLHLIMNLCPLKVKHRFASDTLLHQMAWNLINPSVVWLTSCSFYKSELSIRGMPFCRHISLSTA